MNETDKEEFLAGKTLLIDKPLEWTSFDAVKKIRNTIKIKKVGHAGTLDPLATGLLIICTGKHTKKIESYQGQEKEYTGIISLGKTTPSYDLETAFDSEQPASHITIDQVEKSISENFRGEIEQTPPVFSALKVGGERLYNKARRNEKVEIKSRLVTVGQFTVERFDSPDIYFRIRCSKGTYIRSLAHDLGQQLGCGAYLKSLRRTKIGDFSVEDASDIDSFVAKIKSGSAQ
ncbi:MAG: tRNA pseudouridine(55) synthase TruB [Cyclobacteriaceae bacterium]